MIPYTIGLRASLSSGVSEQIQYQNSSNRKFFIDEILQKSTGSFDITDISDNASLQYSDANGSAPMTGNAFADAAEDTDVPAKLPMALILEGQQILKFTVKDTSSATNEVNIILRGRLERL